VTEVFLGVIALAVLVMAAVQVAVVVFWGRVCGRVGRFGSVI
jgi:hypothetical protein